MEFYTVGVCHPRQFEHQAVELNSLEFSLKLYQEPQINNSVDLFSRPLLELFWLSGFNNQNKRKQRKIELQKHQSLPAKAS